MDGLQTKARNYFMLGRIAEMIGMLSEAATNYFKALFAVDDAKLQEKIQSEPKDHTERFALLKASFPELYATTDRLFTVYRRTYTKSLDAEEVARVKTKIIEAFRYARIIPPTDEEIKEKLVGLLKKRKDNS